MQMNVCFSDSAPSTLCPFRSVTAIPMNDRNDGFTSRFRVRLAFDSGTDISLTRLLASNAVTQCSVSGNCGGGVQRRNPGQKRVSAGCLFERKTRLELRAPAPQHVLE